jgi:hypothetical protein
MKRGRFSEEQIVGILKEHEGSEDRGACLGSTALARRRSTAGRASTAGGGTRSAPAEKSGRREPPVKATGCRSQSGQRGAESDRAKKRGGAALRADATLP